jgi:hypothetical protein
VVEMTRPVEAASGRPPSHLNANHIGVVRERLRCHYCGVPIATAQSLEGYVTDVDGYLIVAPGFAPGCRDHKVPRARGGPDVPANLVPACIRCNSAKGARPYLDFVLDPSRETVVTVGRHPNFEAWSHRAPRRGRVRQAGRKP